MTPRPVGRAAIDIALGVSLEGPCCGRLWLHADPKGEANGLPNWYRSVAGTSLIDQHEFAVLPGPLRGRKNDGRYFSYNEASARRAYDFMNVWRQPLVEHTR